MNVFQSKSKIVIRFLNINFLFCYILLKLGKQYSVNYIVRKFLACSQELMPD